MPKTTQPAVKEQPKTRVRNWISPQRRAKGYAMELKAKVHLYGPKKDQPLTQREIDHRHSYFASLNDSTGLYKYKKALSENKSKAEAREISRQIGSSK